MAQVPFLRNYALMVLKLWWGEVHETDFEDCLQQSKSEVTCGFPSWAYCLTLGVQNFLLLVPFFQKLAIYQIANLTQKC